MFETTTTPIGAKLRTDHSRGVPDSWVDEDGNLTREGNIGLAIDDLQHRVEALEKDHLQGADKMAPTTADAVIRGDLHAACDSRLAEHEREAATQRNSLRRWYESELRFTRWYVGTVCVIFGAALGTLVSGLITGGL